VLGEFQLIVDGAAVLLPHSVERILGFLAIVSGLMTRSRLAGSLWPEVAEHRAHGDLRSALWRLRRIAVAISEEGSRVGLAPEIEVDLSDLTSLTKSLIDGPSQSALERLGELVHGCEILPGWDEEWLIVERERYRLLRLRALDCAAEALLMAGDHAAALDAALASIASEPYREASHRLVVQVHVTEGNNSEALRAYNGYRSLIGDELGILPSPIMEQLVQPLFRARGAMTRG
jgi:DNA-binding SARP family transcriptional activator